jgi:hypothetical protein
MALVERIGSKGRASRSSSHHEAHFGLQSAPIPIMPPSMRNTMPHIWPSIKNARSEAGIDINELIL